MELKALLFDVDGTLADTERDGHRVAFNAAFAEYGLDWHWDVDLYGQLLAVTGGKERMHYYVDRFRGDYAKPDDFTDLVAELHRAKTRHYTRMLQPPTSSARSSACSAPPRSPTARRACASVIQRSASTG